MARITAYLDEGTRVAVTNDRHEWFGDEPIADEGTDSAPTPYELLMGSLAACTALTLRLYARHKQVNLKWVRLEYNFDRVHAEDCAQCDDDATGLIERVQARVTLGGTFDDAQRKRLEQIVSRCPVHKTLAHGMKIFDTVEFADAIDGESPATTQS